MKKETFGIVIIVLVLVFLAVMGLKEMFTSKETIPQAVQNTSIVNQPSFPSGNCPVGVQCKG